jgi:SAM-dependent methyltransferase
MDAVTPGPSGKGDLPQAEDLVIAGQHLGDGPSEAVAQMHGDGPSEAVAHGQYEGSSGMDSVAASRRGWDDMADEYQAEHGDFLGAADFVWCPEGWREADVRLLGAVAGRRILEVGGGAAQCGRWLVGQGADVVSLDLSGRMLEHAQALSAASGLGPGLVQAHAGALPFAADSFDVAFTAFGAIPFVADLARVHGEVARVVRPGGRWVFATTHPVRWAFPDDPGIAGLTAIRSYFDRTPYVEFDAAGKPNYVEHHYTIGDHVRNLVDAGFVIDSLIEPGWPEELTQEWGQWSPLRGAYLPGTLIVAAHLQG